MIRYNGSEQTWRCWRMLIFAAGRGGHFRDQQEVVQTISDFVEESAYQMETELLADEGNIALSKKQLTHIFEVLNHPPAKGVAAIRKLFNERSILDGRIGIDR